MFSFLGSLTAGEAMRKATSYVTRKGTTKTWRSVLKRGLEALCESFEWAEDDLESCRITNVVLRTDSVNQILARVGLRLAAMGCKIDSIVIKITLKMKSDLGLFSEPWHIEVLGLAMNLELGADAASLALTSSTNDAGVRVEPASEPADESADEKPIVLLHKAVESMHLVLRDVRVRINSSAPAVDVRVASAHLLFSSLS